MRRECAIDGVLARKTGVGADGGIAVTRLRGCLAGLLGIATLSSALAEDDWLRLDEQLWAIRDQAESESPSASAQALIQWLHETPIAGIDKSLDLSRSNVETGIFEVIAAVSHRGDHTDALAALEELSERVPNSEWHDDFAAIKAKLLLRLGQVDEALIVARKVGDTICPTSCDVDVKRWLADGSLPSVKRATSPKPSWMFDERGSACDRSWATDKLDEFDSIDLIEGNAGVRAAAQSQLASMWESVVAGCVQAVDSQRLERLLMLGWTKAELASGYATALTSVSAGALRRFDLLGATLDLPAQECDFVTDPTCKGKFKPLSKETALRIVERLRPLDTAWTAPPSESIQAGASSGPSTVDAQDKLDEQYENEMDAAAKLDASPGTARMRKVLADPKYAHLGASLNSYSFGQGLGRWSREGHAAEALEVFKLASDVGGQDFNSDAQTLTALAVLQLRSGEPKAALASLEKRYAMSPDEGTAKTMGKLRSGIGGANIIQQYPAPAVSRPWRHRSGWPICDFFDITGGLERVEDVDVIVAFDGERDAALWQLAQEWPSVVDRCFNPSTWDETRTRVRRALGTDSFAREVANAEKSLKLGASAHFVFAGQELPLPDSEDAPGSSDKAPVEMTPEHARKVIDETHLLSACKQTHFDGCS